MFMCGLWYSLRLEYINDSDYVGRTIHRLIKNNRSNKKDECLYDRVTLTSATCSVPVYYKRNPRTVGVVMFTHIKFVRPSTKSEVIIKPPCGPFDERLFVENPEAVEWAVKMFPDFIPMELLEEQQAQFIMRSEFESDTSH